MQTLCSLNGKLCSNFMLGLCIFAMYSKPSHAAIKPYFIDSDGKKVWWSKIPLYKRESLSKYYDPFLYTPKMMSKYSQTVQAVQETVSAMIFFFKNMLKHMLYYGVFLGLCGLAAKFAGPGGVRWGAGDNGKKANFEGISSIFSASTQDFLETRPYWDQSQIPMNTFNITHPLKCKCGGFDEQFWSSCALITVALNFCS